MRGDLPRASSCRGQWRDKRVCKGSCGDVEERRDQETRRDRTAGTTRSTAGRAVRRQGKERERLAPAPGRHTRRTRRRPGGPGKGSNGPILASPGIREVGTICSWARGHCCATLMALMELVVSLQNMRLIQFPAVWTSGRRLPAHLRIGAFGAYAEKYRARSRLWGLSPSLSACSLTLRPAGALHPPCD